MEMPLVTVLIPVYNRPIVVNTISSIIEQTYKNLEILVIDNASTDDTVLRIQSIRDNRIRLVINEKNIGQTGSLNKGLILAKGKYIARIDSDDIAFPERIEKQVYFMENNREFVLCGSWIQYISDSDEIGGVLRMPTTDRGFRFMQTFACAMHHPTSMYRTETIRTHNITYSPDIKMAEDYALWFELSKHGKACNLAEPLVYYRRGDNNDSICHLDIMKKELYDLRLKICEYHLRGTLKQKMLGNIEKINNGNLGIIDTLKYGMFMFRYLKTVISKSELDYKILRTQIAQYTYVECIEYNNRCYMYPIKLVYHLLQRTKHK